MPELRVAQVVEASAVGVGRHVLDLSEWLIANGVTVDLYYATGRAESRFVERSEQIPFRKRVSIDASADRVSTSLRAIRSVRHGLEIDAVDVVHGHSSFGGAWARLSARPGAVTVYTPNALITQSPFSRRPTRWVQGSVERLLSRRTDGLICVSSAEMQHAQDLHLRPRSVELINNGIPPCATAPVERDVIRNELALPQGVPIVGFVGRLAPQKGLPLLLSAARVLHRDTGALVAVIGDGPDRDELHQFAADRDLGDCVRWLGRSNGERAMSAFDVLAVPSVYEGFPYVVLEALRTGVPVVATNQANVHELLGDGMAGRSVERTPAAFGAALIEILEDEDRAREMGRAGRDVARRFTIESMGHQTLGFYRRLTDPVQHDGASAPQ